MLTDILDTLRNGSAPRLVEVGKIKIGGLGEARQTREGKTWRMPRKDDHFTLTTLQRDNAGGLVVDQALMDSLSPEWADHDGKLRRIPIYLLSDDLEDVIQASYCWYGGKACAARSDGKETTWYVDQATMKFRTEPLVEPFDPDILEATDAKGNNRFKLHSNFNCIVRSASARFGGVHRFRTTSKISFDQLYGSLVQIMALTGGVLSGMPLVLCVRPIQVSPRVNGTVTPSTVHVVHCELLGDDLLSVQRLAMERAKHSLEYRRETVAVRRALKQLVHEPGLEPATEAAEINEEFQPETTAPEPVTSYSIIDGYHPPLPPAANPSTAGGSELPLRRTDSAERQSAESERPNEAGPTDATGQQLLSAPAPAQDADMDVREEAPEDGAPPDAEAGLVEMPDPCPRTWIVDMGASLTGRTMEEVDKRLRIATPKPWEKLSRDTQMAVLQRMRNGVFFS